MKCGVKDLYKYIYYSDCCVPTWLCVSPRQDVHPAPAERAIGVGLCAVDDLLRLRLFGVLSFHTHLQNRHLLLLQLPGPSLHPCALGVHPHHTLLHS